MWRLNYLCVSFVDSCADFQCVPGVTPSQLALAWCASRWYVASTIIGATTMEQCKENIDAFDMELSEETLKAMDAVHLEQKDPAMLL